MPPQGAEAFPFRTDTLPSNSLSDDAATKIPDRAAQQNNFGIGLVGAGANDNVIIDNVVTGNTNGIFLASVVSGNLIRRNLVAENAPVQVSVSTPTPVGVDIRNLAPADANTIVDNVCLTAVGLACPSVEDTTLRIRR